MSSPDYETPADANTDNIYMITVNASAGTDMDSLDVTVTVTDVDDDGHLSHPPCLRGTMPTATTILTSPRSCTAIDDYIFRWGTYLS